MKKWEMKIRLGSALDSIDKLWDTIRELRGRINCLEKGGHKFIFNHKRICRYNAGEDNQKWVDSFVFKCSICDKEMEKPLPKLTLVQKKALQELGFIIGKEKK